MPYASKDLDGTRAIWGEEQPDYCKQLGAWRGGLGSIIRDTSDTYLLDAIFPLGVKCGECVRIGRLPILRKGAKK